MKKPLFVPVTLLQRVVKFSVTKGKGFLAIILLFLFSSFSGAKDKQNYLISKTSSGLHPLVDYFEYAQKEYVQGEKQLSRTKDSYVLAAFAPPPTGNTLWFRADKGVDAADGSLDTDDTISTWHDQQGGDNNGIQAVAHGGESGESPNHIPGMPSYVYTNTDHFNFNPLIRFDQTTNSNSGEAVEFVTPSLNDQTVFVVFKNVRGFNNSNPGNLNHIGGGNSNDRADIAFNYTANGNLAVGGGFSGDFNYRGTNGLNAATRSHAVIGVFTRDADGNDTAAFTLYANGSPDQNNGQSVFSTAGASRIGSGFPLTTPIRIGKHNSNDSNADSNLDGDVAEVLTFDGVLSEVDRKKVESYLAIKYGITLNGDTDKLGVNEGNVNYNYVDSDGNAIWITDLTYNRDIAGLGLDSGYDLNQQISKSVNPDAIVTMAIDTDFSEGNLKNRGSITDKDFLIWGNDGVILDEITTEIPASSVTHRLTREWRVQKTGTSIANISVQIDLNGSSHTGTVSTLYLMVDKDNDGDFSTGTIEYFPAASLNGDVAQFNNVNFDNNNVFTVATRALVVIDPCDAAASGNTDTDGDGISDICDEDDDNDGILDINETSGCGTSDFEASSFIENFGTGTNRSSTPFISSSYTFQSTGDTADGFYAITNNTSNAASFAAWENFDDHTIGDTDGKMLVINASLTAGEFYRRSLNNLIKQTDVTLSFWVRDICPTCTIKPNVTYRIEDALGNVLITDSTGPLNTAPNPAGWNEFTLTTNTGNNTELQLVLINNGPGGSGNDLAIDDISLKQFVCDTDNDGIPDYLDTDSDNDGCSDASEGANNITTGLVDLAGGSNGGSIKNLGTTVNAQGVPNNGGTSQVQNTTTEVVNATQLNAVGPTDISVVTGLAASFTVTATADTATSYTTGTPNYGTPGNANAGINYQWYLGDPTVPANILSNTGVYSNVTTATLNISDVTGLTGNQYFVVVTHDDNECISEKRSATLTVTAPVDPCTDASGTDTDGDGINDVCDEDDDNDGISDVDEGFVDDTTYANCIAEGFLLSGNPSQIFEIDLNTGATNSIGTLTFALGGAAFNELDGYFWGRNQMTGDLAIIDPTDLSTVQTVALGLSGNAGAINTSNNTYVHFSNTTTNIIDINPASATYEQQIGTGTVRPDNIPDLAYAPNRSSFYGIKNSTNELYEYNPIADSWVNLGAVTGLPAGSYGAAYSTLGGDVYVGNNTTGNIYKIDTDQVNFPTTINASFFAAGPAASTNDGARCLFRDVDGNVIQKDTDNDGIPDYLDTDSDNDGCPDASEGANNITTGLVALTGGSNGGSSLHLGTTVNGQGVPTNTGSPQVGTTEVINATRFTINTDPTNSSVASGATASFTVTATADTATSYTTGTPNYGTAGNANAGINYQWYLGDPDASGAALANTGVYSNVTTATLNISDATGLNTNEYYVVITHDDNECVSEKRSATLTVAAPIDPCDAAASGNTDTDGDGISDICDVDDDNDGILDVDEQASCGIFGDPSMEADDDSLPGHGSNYDSFANSFPSSSAWSNSNGTAGFFIAGQIPTSLDTALEPYEGNSYIGFHSQGTYTNEVFRNNLTANIVNGNSYTIAFAAYQMNLIAPAGGGNLRNSGSVKFFGIKNGTNPTLNGANQANPTTIEAIPEVDLLATSALVDNTTAWKVYTVTFTAADDYDRVLISVDGTDSFLGFDNIRMACNLDTDNDGIFNHLDTDSDNDGCPDASEGANNITTGLVDLAGGSNGGSIKNLGTTVNAQGVPNNGGTSQVQNTTTEVVNATQLNAVGPTDISVVTGLAASFTVTATADTATSYTTGTPNYGTPGNANAGINYQWYLGDPTVPANILSNTGVYSNVTTATLNISDVTGLTGNQYFVVVTHDDNECISVVENATLTVTNPSIELTKTSALSNDVAPTGLGLGDTVTYTLVVENTGDVTLSNISLTDALVDANGTSLTLTTPLVLDSSSAGSSAASLLVGGTLTYTATYVITQSDVDAGGISNSAVVRSEAPGGDTTDTTDDITDNSDDGDDTDGNTSDDPTEDSITTNPSIELTKTSALSNDVAPTGLGLGDTVTYTLVVENTGDVTLSNVSLTDALVDANGTSLTLTTPLVLDSSSAGSSVASLLVGGTLTYTATYVITQSDVDAGGISNSAVVRSEAPGGDTTDTTDDITDNSDDGDDTDGNTSDDPTEDSITTNPSIELTKTSALSNDVAPTGLGLGDTVTYTLVVENTGDVTLSNVSLTDALVDANGTSLTLTTPLVLDSSSAGSSAASLLVGGTLTYTATYVITQSDVDAGGISNSAVVRSEAPGGDTTDTTDDITDNSDDGDDTDGNTSDDPTEDSITTNPSIELTKTSALSNDVAPTGLGLGDTVTYTLVVENTGDVTLSNISLTDALVDANGTSLTLTTPLVLDSSSAGSSAASLLVDGTLTYTATYVITQSDVDAGGISNSAVVRSEAPGGDTTDTTDDITDNSDDGDDTDGNTSDDPTEDSITTNPSIELTKTSALSNDVAPVGLGLGDTVTYTLVVENTGDVTLSNISLTDALVDANGTGLTLTTPLVLDSSSAGSSAASLLVDGTLTYTATYVITQSDVDAGGISNSAVVRSEAPGGDTTDTTDDITDNSDDGDDTDGNTSDDPTEDSITTNPSIELTKTSALSNDVAPTGLGLGDTVTYTLVVENTGDVTLSNVSLTDALVDANGTALTLTTPLVLDSSSAGSSAASLLVDGTLTYTATYVITQSDVDAGGISNSAVVRSEAPGGDTTDTTDDITDNSDDGDDTDGNTSDDPTEDSITTNPSIELTKTSALSNDVAPTGLGLGDTVTYTLVVENTGDVTLSNVSLTDALVDANGTSLTLTTPLVLDSSSAGSSAASLLVGGRLTYTATYVITQSDVDAGGISNSAVVRSEAPGGDTTDTTDDITDNSDDGDDTDGNTSDDPTEDSITTNPSIELTKTSALSNDVAPTGLGLGDTVTYTLVVENTGDVTLSNVSLTDALVDANGTSLTLTTPLVLDSSSAGSSVASLLVGGTLTYTATYVITQSDVDAGGISNSAVVRSEAPGGDTTDTTDDITDNSDDGDDTDGNTSDDPTEDSITTNPSIELTKTSALSNDVAPTGLGLGDTVTYTLVVENTGDVTLSNVSLTDALVDANGTSLTLTTPLVLDSSSAGSSVASLLVGGTLTYTATYVITQSDVDAGGISNSAVVRSEAPGGDTTDTTDDITDNSDDGDDTDGNTSDDPTEDSITTNPSIELTKTSALSNDVAPTGLGLGDTVTYTLVVENTGDVTLSNVSLTDALVDANGTSLTLTTPLVLDSSSAGSSVASLLVGGTLTYTATYVITQSDVDAGGISNSAVVRSEAPGGDTTDTTDDITDNSDDGDDTDGNTSDDPTEDSITTNPSIELTKTSALSNDVAPTGLGLGDTVTYTLVVENTGDVTLSNVSLTDALVDANGTSLTLTTPLVLDSSSAGSSAASLLVGGTLTYTATYVITQSDVDAGGISNSAVVRSEAPGGDTTDTTDDITDNSDDGDDTDGNTSDDPTEDSITTNPSIELTKTSALSNDVAPTGLGLGDTVTYTLVVENKGDVTLSNVSLTDALVDANGTSLTLTTPLVLDSSSAGSSAASLLVGGTLTYTATYVITQSDVDAGGISNSAVVRSEAPGGDTTDTTDDITDNSDDGDDTDGNTSDDPTENSITTNPSIELTKTSALSNDVAPTGLGLGDTVTYTLVVENTGDVTLSNVSLIDALVDANGTLLTLTTPLVLDSSSAGSSAASLLVDGTLTYTATYVITQSDVDAGGISNSAVVRSEAPGGDTTDTTDDITDNSDDGDDTDGNTSDDPTEDSITTNPSIELTKTSALSNDVAPTGLGLGDTVTYTLVVENTGDVTLSNVSLTDALVDANGTSLTLTTPLVLDSSSVGSSAASLLVDGTLTYTATYVITQSDVDAGGISNSAVVRSEAPGGDTTDTTDDITDNSDDGDDTDGNTSDDPTEDDINQTPAITVVKTIVDADKQVGGEVTYKITVTNTGNITLNDVKVTDTKLGLDAVMLTPSTLASGENSFIEKSYTITQADMDRGYVENTASGAAVAVNGDAVTDVSDTDIDADGDAIDSHQEVDSPDGEGNTDGNSGNDVTVLNLEQDPGIMVTKNAEYVDVDGNQYVSVGDEIRYTFEVTNTGNVTLTNVTIEDAMLTGPFGSLEGGPISLGVGETDTNEFTGVYKIQQLDIDKGWVENTAEVVATSPEGSQVRDVSDTGTDGEGNSIPDNENDETPDGDGSTDGDTTNDPTVTTFNKDTCLTIYNEFSPNGDDANEYFEIDCIESYPGNTLEVFNRWGNTVYKKKDYDNSWDGTSNGRATVNGSDKLPVGTYYYVLDLNDGSKPRTGWLYLNR